MSFTDEADFWPEARCLQLIREYKSRTLLWDPENPMFHNRKLKQVAWQNIAKVLNTTAKACRSKMFSLNASFNREKLKVLRSLNSDRGIYRSRWYGYKEMVSMFPKRNKIQVKKEEKNLDDNVVKNILLADDAQVAPSVVTTSFPPCTSATCNESTVLLNDEIELKIEPTSDSELESVLENRKSESPKHYQIETVTTPSVIPELHRQHDSVELTENLANMSEIVPFTLFVQSKMMKYSPKTLTAVQRAICDVLFKADEEHYKNNSSGESSSDPIGKK